jgi:hypothetical protein
MSMSPAATIRLLTVALLIAVAAEIGTIVGFIVWLDTTNPSTTILKAGAAFAGTIGLGIGLWSVLRPR